MRTGKTNCVNVLKFSRLLLGLFAPRRFAFLFI